LIGLVLAIVIAAQAECVPLTQVDVFGEVPFDTVVTAEMIGTTLRGTCGDLDQPCRLRDRTGVVYEVTGGRIVAKTRPAGWGVELPFGLTGRSYGQIDAALNERGIPPSAIQIIIGNDPGSVEAAVCDRSLKLKIFQNTAGRARAVALIPADRD
jgi:hypothetical protein